MEARFRRLMEPWKAGLALALLTCAAGAGCSPGPEIGPGGAAPGSTWHDCSVGADPTKNGGDLLWAQVVPEDGHVVGPLPDLPSVLQRLAVGPTGDIALGLSLTDECYPHICTALFHRFDGSGSLLWGGEYRVGGGMDVNVEWDLLAIAPDDDLLAGVYGTVSCGGSIQFEEAGGDHIQASFASYAYGIYCGVDAAQRFTPDGHLANTSPSDSGIPDGAGGVYYFGKLGPGSGPGDFGCGPVIGSSSSQAYLAHVGPLSNCIYQRILQIGSGLSVVADVHGAVLSASSTTSLDLGCGALPAAPGGSTFVSRLDPTGKCVFGKSFDTPGLSVQLDPSGNPVVSDVVGATPFDLGCGPLAPLGTADLVLGVLDGSGNCSWSKRFGAPGVSCTAPSLSATAAGDIYLRTACDGAVDLGGGPLAATSGDLVVGSFTPLGAHRWSRALPIEGQYLAGVDGCGSLVVASSDPSFDVGQGTLITNDQGTQQVAFARYAP